MRLGSLEHGASIVAGTGAVPLWQAVVASATTAGAAHTVLCQLLAQYAWNAEEHFGVECG